MWFFQISDAVHGPENMKCHVLQSANGCRDFKQCHDMKTPAAYFILNSFVSLSNVSLCFCISRTAGLTWPRR